MSSNIGIVTSAATCRGKPSPIRSMDNSNRYNAEQKESKALANGLSVSLGLSLAAAAMVATTAFATLAGTARATVIYQDSFNRVGQLGGSTPTVDTGGLGGTANATWATPLFGTSSSDTGWTTSTANGGYLAYSGATNGAHEFALLPFSPQAGQIYQLQTTAVLNDFGNSSSDWFGLQFLNVSAGAYSATGPAMIYRVYGGGTGFPNGIGGSGSVAGSPGGGSTTNISDTVVLTEVLNTTGSVWTAAFSWKDLTTPTLSVSTAPADVNMTPTGDMSDNMVGFGFVPPIGGTITNFSLTTIPEPASLGFLAGAIALALLLIQRRRSA